MCLLYVLLLFHFSMCIMNIEKHCDHSVVAFELCAICGLNLKRYNRWMDA